jgi:hypothetical protein
LETSLLLTGGSGEDKRNYSDPVLHGTIPLAYLERKLLTVDDNVKTNDLAFGDNDLFV